MKKLFPDKKESKKALASFLDKKGFYIVLILCITLIGATAVFVTTHNITSSMDVDPENIIPEGTSDSITSDSGLANIAGNTIALNDSAKVTSNPSPKVTPAGNAVGNTNKAGDIPKAQTTSKPAAIENSPKQTAKPKQDKTSEKDSKGTTAKSSKQEKRQKFIKPVFGEVTFDFAQNKLVYSKTLDEWRTHSGLDLAADRGTSVKAVADGVVVETKNDPRFGVTVVIEHANGLKTVYANLASDEMVSPNQKINQGDIIGCVGNTAGFESAEQPHLHFEVLKDNESVNPSTYLPTIKAIN